MGFARGVKKQKGWLGIFPRDKTLPESVKGYARNLAGIVEGYVIFVTRYEFILSGVFVVFI